MKQELESFIRKVPDFERLVQKEKLAFFALFLTDVLGDKSVRPIRIRQCFDVALLDPPSNISAAMTNSGYFVSTKGDGQQLGRATRSRLEGMMKNGDRPATAVAPTSSPERPEEAAVAAPVAASVPGITKNVMVVYGRNRQISDSMFSFLRALKLNPIEWSEAVKETGKGSPYVGEILDAAFKMAQAVVVLLTPDEQIQLRRELCSDKDEYEHERGFQPRANVLIEAGMALAKAEPRTVLVEFGDVLRASDLDGRHAVRLDDSPEKRNELASRLRTAGCDPDTGNQGWYRAGSFKVNTKRKRDGK
jgi:predicted nucleotide-binding protein